MPIDVDLRKYLPGLSARSIRPDDLQQGSIIVSVPLGAVANTTTRTGVLPVQRGSTVRRIVLGNRGLAPSSALGVVTLAVGNRDASVPADDNLLAAATVDLETSPGANAVATLTLTATAADLALAAGDQIYAEVVTDDADAVNLDGLSLLVELTVD